MGNKCCQSEASLKPPPEIEVKVPEELAQYLRAASGRLSTGQPVVPCASSSCAVLHGNVLPGPHRGFCAEACKRKWVSSGIDNVKAAGGDLEQGWQAMDMDFVLQLGHFANLKTVPFGKMKAIIETGVEKQAEQYQDCVRRLPPQERWALDKVREEGELWPAGLSDETLVERCTQDGEARSLPDTYACGLRCYEQLFRFTVALAYVAESQHSVQFSVKRPARIFRKTIDDHPVEFADNDFRHCWDVYRTAIVLDTVSQVGMLLGILKGLGRDAADRLPVLQHLGFGAGSVDYVVERIKNRFARPCPGGYMDALINVRVDGYVGEVQLHLQRFWDVKGEAGLRICRWASRYVGAEDRYVGDRSADGQMHGRGVYFYGCGERYEGEFCKDKVHGRGICYYGSGDRYEGEWHLNTRHGRGAFCSAGGSRYEGAFFEGKMHGKGTSFYPDAARYEGEHVNGVREGQGILFAADGARYEGAWRRDRWHGLGAHFRTSGEVDVGTFDMGDPTGLGVRWSTDRSRAWRLMEGKLRDELETSEAATLGAELGFPRSISVQWQDSGPVASAALVATAPHTDHLPEEMGAALTGARNLGGRRTASPK